MAGVGVCRFRGRDAVRCGACMVAFCRGPSPALLVSCRFVRTRYQASRCDPSCMSFV